MAVYELSVSMVDAFGRNKTKRFQLEEVDYATAMASATGFVQDLLDVSLMGMTSFSLATKVANISAAEAGANVDVGATITALKADGDKAPLKIPHPLPAAINPDGTIDLTETAMAAFLANYTSGNVLISDGETVTSFLSGKLDK